MSWTDFYARRDAIDLVLAHADRNPGHALPLAELPQVSAVFDSTEELALALQYKWSQLLLGRMGVALAEAERDEDVDSSEAVAAAWRRTAAQAPVLRAVLDRHVEDAGPRFRAALAGEQRTVAYAAGLAEFGEPAEEVARVGGAFLALVRADSTQAAHRTHGPIEQLLRRLVASA